MISIIDAFENILDLELTYKNANDLKKMNKQQIEKLRDGCLLFMSQFIQTFDTSISLSTTIESGSCAYLDSRYTNLYIAIGNSVSLVSHLRTVSRFLLYYPSVAINDGFLIKQWKFPEMREYLARYFSNLSSLAPLVKKGIVYLVPYYPGEDHESTSQLAKVLIKEFKIPHPKEDLEHVSWANFAREYAISSYFDSFVPYCTEYDDERPLLIKVLKKGSAVTRINKELEATTVAEVFSRLQLPKISRLSVNDILAIRENDEAFARWRSQLQHVITHMHLLAATGRKTSAEDFQALANPLLAEEAAQLREETKAERGVSYIKDSFIGFSIAAVSSLVTTGLTNIDWKTLAAGSGVGLLYSLMFKRSSKSDKALLKHYALFDGLGEQEYGGN